MSTVVLGGGNLQPPWTPRLRPVCRRHPALGLLAVLLLSAFGVPGPVVRAVPRQARTSELDAGELPRADLSELPPAARRHVEDLLEALQAAVLRSEALRTAGEETPGSLAEGLALLGRLYQAYELPDAAEEAYGLALERQPDRGDFHHLRGLVRRELGDLEGAHGDFAAAVAAIPEVAASWLHLGETLLELGRADEAKAAFEEAQARGAPRATVAFGLGRAAAGAGDLAAAVEHLESARSLQPSATLVHASLAGVYERQGEVEKAREERAHSGVVGFSFPDPLAEGVHRIRAETAFEAAGEMAAQRQGFDEKEYLRFVERRLRAVPDVENRLRHVLTDLPAAAEDGGPDGGGPDGGAPGEEPARRLAGRLRLALGTLLLQNERLEEAIVELRTAVRLAPDLREARLELGDALALEGRLQEAAATFDDLLALEPERGDAQARRAAVRVSLGELQAARADLRKAVEVSSDAATEAAAHTLLGRLELRRGNYSLAATELQMAVENDPENPAPLETLARVQGEVGSYRESAATFHHLAELVPADPVAREGEAVALILAGDEAAARRRLEEAVEVLPEEPALQGRLARLLAASSDPALRDGERAVELARAVFEVDPSLETVETLAMAYAEAGALEEAVRWQKRLLGRAAPGSAQAAAWERNLERYEAGMSCCAAPETLDEEPETP